MAMHSSGWFIPDDHLIGGGKLKFTCDETGLHVSLPEGFDRKIAFALRIR
jgi:hypothetical protein